MAIKKSQLYSKLWEACDELRGGMDASQYKDYVLVVLFIKYLSDKKKSGDKSLLIELPKGCSFDDLVLLKGSKDIGFPPKLAYPFIWLGALLLGRFRLGSSDAASAVKNTSIPILLIHGEEDFFVPLEMSQKIHKNAPNSQLHTFPDAGHGLSYLKDPNRYEEVCSDFLKDIF